LKTLEHYTQTIQKYYPDLKVETAEFNQDGQYNDVVIVNGNLVFRFAKVPTAIKTLRQEIAVQHSIHDRVSLQIPSPTYAQINTDIVGEAFSGCPRIPGKPLWRTNFRKITDASSRNRMARQLAIFLSELHNIPPDSIPVELTVYDNPQENEDMYQRIKTSLFPYMRSDAQEQVSAHFEHYLENPDLYGFEPRLRHGDFGTGNILYDTETLSIVGVLDFGSVGIGDPASDFAGLFISFGEEFYQHCCDEYPEMEAAIDRVHFYCGTFALEEALFGIENGDDEAFQSGIAKYV